MVGMASKAHGVLAQIEAGVLDDTVSLSSILQKVIILGGRAGSEKMREWARQELNGYSGPDFPHYRRLHPPLYVRLTNRAGYNGSDVRLAPHQIPEQIREMARTDELSMDSGVGELEALVAAAATDPSKEPFQISPYWGDALADLITKHQNDYNTRAESVFFKVSAAAIKGLLVQVRTALAELVADLVALTPEGDDVPTQADSDRVMQFIITGERATVNYTNQNSTSGSNISAPNADSAVVATDSGTAIGSQTASGDAASIVGSQSATGKNASVTGVQSVHGNEATVAGRYAAQPVPKEEPKGFWARLRKRGLFVALFTVVAGLTGLFTWLGWTPWS
jgi:hypothetical protein